MFAGGKNVLTVIEQSYFHSFENSTLFESRVWILIHLEFQSYQQSL